MLPIVAEDFLRVFAAVLIRVFLLRGHQFLADADCRQLIPPNAPIQNFFLARFGVEVPRVTFLHERYWRRPIMRANI